MKRVKTQTINVDQKLWEDAKALALKNHDESVSIVVSRLLQEWNNAYNKHVTIKSTHLSHTQKVRRSLYCDIDIWKNAKDYAKSHFGKSGSYVIDVLLRNWVHDEKKRKIDNPNQARLI
ncbi:MAG: hypothetical protein OEW60_07060 [Thiovulaceae bacterium]|nr:hypothetical protein [Sulfurimonadaceae bacterium]